ncbi:hypothetical protein MtrunA17_Chr7g0237131 [Medicago truncatula]|uniref:Uncharacterized protein n=1 Tax=Medicago truncatula TaxID=3880 RepID=A0A396GXV6_MEDTR|nr:hypothetical protein MtrunA17_Chr7g0237131 [Medicago truncatula]
MQKRNIKWSSHKPNLSSYSNLEIIRLLVSRGGRYAGEWIIVNNSFRTNSRYFMYSNTY